MLKSLDQTGLENKILVSVSRAKLWSRLDLEAKISVLVSFCSEVDFFAAQPWATRAPKVDIWRSSTTFWEHECPRGVSRATFKKRFVGNSNIVLFFFNLFSSLKSFGSYGRFASGVHLHFSQNFEHPLAAKLYVESEQVTKCKNGTDLFYYHSKSNYTGTRTSYAAGEGRGRKGSSRFCLSLHANSVFDNILWWRHLAARRKNWTKMHKINLPLSNTP